MIALMLSFQREERLRMPRPVDVKVGETIRQLRIDRRLSQSDLAISLGISYAQVQKYETGKNRVSASRLVQIANVFGIDVNVFFEGARIVPVDPINDNFLPKELMTKQGLELLKAFHAIQNSFVRAKLLTLVKSVAKDQSGLDFSPDDKGVLI
jgi:transcriptional regulator with XRE-family HTH domain